MKKNSVTSIFLLLIIIILLSTPLITGLKTKESHQDIKENYKFLEKGWFEERDGIKILHISGSHYEMGYQYGYYLKEDHIIRRRIWLNFVEESGYPIDRLKECWNITKDYIPEVYIQEIQGRADALGIDFVDEAVMSILISSICNQQHSCIGFSAWGNATSDGKLYHAHSNDWPLRDKILKDPITKTYAYQYQLIIVRKPDDAYASVSIGTTGGIEAESGMNEKGICISFNTAFHYTNDSTIKGIPSGLRNMMVLDYAKNSQEAIDILNSNRTAGWNYILSDGNEKRGYILEQTANYSYAGSWNNTIENNYPSHIIQDVARRGNIFLNYDAPGISKQFYENSSLLKMILNFFGFTDEKSVYLSILHFNVASKEIEKKHGTLNLNTSMELLRRVYNGRTNFIFFLFQRIIRSLYADTWDQKVFCPETGDIAISFAKNGKTAYRSPVHYFNMYELLDSESS